MKKWSDTWKATNEAPSSLTRLKMEKRGVAVRSRPSCREPRVSGDQTPSQWAISTRIYRLTLRDKWRLEQLNEQLRSIGTSRKKSGSITKSRATNSTPKKRREIWSAASVWGESSEKSRNSWLRRPWRWILLGKQRAVLTDSKREAKLSQQMKLWTRHTQWVELSWTYKQKDVSGIDVHTQVRVRRINASKKPSNYKPLLNVNQFWRTYKPFFVTANLNLFESNPPQISEFVL